MSKLDEQIADMERRVLNAPTLEGARHLHELLDKLRERRRALLSAGDKAAHVHEWIDARNEVVEAGEVCLCGAFRAGNRSAGDKAKAPPDPTDAIDAYRRAHQ